MLSTLFVVLQALALTSASAIDRRQNGGAVAGNIPTQETFNEPARGEGRRILVWGRPDLALTVLGEPAAGTAVGIAYTLDSGDANASRQIYDVNLHDDDDEPNQFDYDDDDDELRLRGTQLCVTMSSPGTLTLENCDDSRDDDNNWIQDWEFDDDQDSGNQWVRIEDDDDDNRCLTASLDGWSNDEAQLTVEQCSNSNANQRFYQVLPGTGAGAAPSGSGAPSGSPSSTTSGGPSGTPTQSGAGPSTSSPSGTDTSAPGSTSSPSSGRPRANMWGRGIFKLLAEL